MATTKNWLNSSRKLTPRTTETTVAVTPAAATLLMDSWMGHANRHMSGRYGKQLLDNVRWRQECTAKVGLGFTLPEGENEPLLDKSGQSSNQKGKKELQLKSI